MWTQLFNSQDARDSFQYYLDEANEKVRNKSDDYILQVNKEEFLASIYSKYDYPELEVFESEASVAFKKKGIKTRQFQNKSFDIETHIFSLKVPFRGWSFLFSLTPSNRLMDHPNVNIPNGNSGEIEMEFEVFDMNETEFDRLKNQRIKALVENTPRINTDLRNFKSQLKSSIERTFELRKQKAETQNEFFKKINISIDKKTNQTFKVQPPTKHEIPEPKIKSKSLSNSSKSFNYTINEEFYEDIINEIGSFYQSLENKPNIHTSKDEEGLRDYLLPYLERRYKSTTVTGETFNNFGKTDILFKHDDGTILFVIECKFWKGKKVLFETINQLFDKYLTWRDSHAAIIFFVRTANFTDVIATLKQEIKEHEYYVSEDGQHSNTSLSYKLHFPGDPEKLIRTEILLFHFPK